MLSGHFRFTVFLHLKWIILLACFWMQLPTPGFAQPAANPDAATQLFQEASRLQNAGKFEAALAKWRQFIAKHADDAAVGQAYGGLGTCLLETGKPAEAIEAFNQALNRLPKGESGSSLRWNRAVACYRRAEKSRKEEYFQEAAKALDAIVGDQGVPKNRRALATFYLAKTEQARGTTEAATQHYRHLVKDAPDKSLVPPSLLALASLAEDAADWPEAIRLYREFLQGYPEHASADEARLGLADALLKSGRRDEAEVLFGQLLKRKNLAAADYALYRWGELAFLRGDHGATCKRLATIIENYPKSAYRAPALLIAGEAHLQAKDYPQAVKFLEQFLAEKPKKAERQQAEVRIALALFESGNPARADERLKEVLGRLDDPGLRGQALVLWARCATKLKHAGDAVTRYGECFKPGVKLAEAEQTRFEAVAVAFAAGDGAHGLDWTGELVEHFPKSPLTSQAQLLAARWLADKQNYDEAMKRCGWVIDAKVPETQPMTLYLSGFCAMKLRKFEEAARSYQTLLDKHPKFEQVAAARYSLAVAHEALGESKKAIEAYQQLLKHHPNDPLASKARERLKVLQRER